MDYPVIDHRSAEFANLGVEVLEGLRKIFQTASPVVLYPASGTGAWEAAIVNTLSPGDRVILFTDGVTEACGVEGEEFGEARLLHLLEDQRALSAEELQAKILDVVGEFSGGRWQDDATLLVLAVGE